MDNLTVWDVLAKTEEMQGTSHAQLLALGSDGLDEAIAEAVANGWLWPDEHEIHRLTDDGQAALDTHRLG